jgi:hypothetical protein
VRTLLLCLVLAGCAAQPSARVAPTAPPDHSRAAFLWSRPGGSIAGDADIASAPDGRFSLRLTKNLPSPLLEFTASPDGKFSVSGPLAGGRWRGSSPPARLALWPALASAWQWARTASDGRQEAHTATYRAALWKESGKLRELTVSSNDSSEVVRLIVR